MFTRKMDTTTFHSSGNRTYCKPILLMLLHLLSYTGTSVSPPINFHTIYIMPESTGIFYGHMFHNVAVMRASCNELY